MGILMQVLCSGSICCLFLSIGIMYAWPSSTLRLFESVNTVLHRPMTETELALLGSLTSIGSLVSIPGAGILLDKIGRKYCSIIGALLNVVKQKADLYANTKLDNKNIDTAVCCVCYVGVLGAIALCWTIISLSNRVEAVMTSAFVSGLGGSVFVTVPIYINEICEESIRGVMTSGSMMVYGLGMLLSYLFSGYLEYFTMIYVSLSLAVMVLVTVLFLRESSVFLMTVGLEEEAARSIAFYRGIKPDDKEVVEEINTIRRSLNPDMDTPGAVSPEEEKLYPVMAPVQKLSIWQFIRKSRSTRRAMFVSLVLITASMFQGLAVVQVYAEPLFSEAVPTMSPTLCSVLLAVVGVLAGFLAAYLTNLAGRRALMIYSSIGSGICCVVLGTQIHFNWGPNWITAGVIYLFTVVYTAGAGTVPFVLPAEIFLPEVKSFVSMLVMEWMNACSSIVLFIFNPLVHAIGMGQLFYVFSVICFLTAVFCQFFLPETKGKSVEEIQLAFAKKKCLPSAV